MKKPLWHKLINIVILVFAAYFLCKICINVFSHPYAVNEYREGADVQLTQAFLEDDNPYRLESLSDNRDSEMPPVLYQYSFLNSALGAFVALFTGRNAVLALYILAVLSMIGSSLLVYFMIRRSVKNTSLPLLGAVLTLFCHWRFGYISTTPNSLGIFLILLTTFFATKEKMNSNLRLLLTAFLSVLCFYTKLYYVTVAFGVFVFYFLYKKSEAWKYFGYCIGLGVLSVVIIQIIWPLYFTYSVYFVNGMGLWFMPRALRLGLVPGDAPAGALTMKVNINFTAFSYVFEQFGYLIVAFAALFAILIFSIITGVIKRRKIEITPGDTLALTSILSITQGLCLLFLGKADGAYLSYFLQLWMPFIIISSMICADKYVISLLGDIKIIKNIKLKQFLEVGFIAALAFVSIYFAYHKLPLHLMTDDEINDWDKACEYVDEFGTEEIYYAPELAYLAIFNDERAYDNGHVAVASEKGLQKWREDDFSQSVFPYADDIALQNIAYREDIAEGFKNHDYSLITLDDYGFLGDKEFNKQLEEYGYKRIDTLPLAVGNAVYNVEFWTL